MMLKYAEIATPLPTAPFLVSKVSWFIYENGRLVMFKHVAFNTDGAPIKEPTPVQAPAPIQEPVKW